MRSIRSGVFLSAIGRVLRAGPARRKNGAALTLTASVGKSTQNAANHAAAPSPPSRHPGTSGALAMALPPPFPVHDRSTEDLATASDRRPRLKTPAMRPRSMPLTSSTQTVNGSSAPLSMNGLLLTVLLAGSAAAAQQPASGIVITATTHTPIVASAAAPGFAPQVNSVVRGLVTDSGYQVAAASGPQGGNPALASAGSQLTMLSALTLGQVLLHNHATIDGLPVAPGSSAFVTTNDVLISFTPSSPIDATLELALSDRRTNGAIAVTEVDFDADGTVDFTSTPNTFTTATVQLPRFSSAPVTMLVRSSISASAIGMFASASARLTIQLRPRGTPGQVSGCLPGVRVLSQPLLDGGIGILMFDSVTAGGPNTANALTIGTPLATPTPLPFSSTTSCTLDVAPTVLTFGVSFGGRPTQTIEWARGVPLGARPLTVTLQLLGAVAAGATTTLHSSAPLSVTFP